MVNKDTGEVVGDLRNESQANTAYDVLPAHFRPSEAWHAPAQEVSRRGDIV